MENSHKSKFATSLMCCRLEFTSADKSAINFDIQDFID